MYYPQVAVADEDCKGDMSMKRGMIDHDCQKPNVDDVLQVAVADEDGKGVVDYEAFATLLTSHRK